MSNDLIPYFDDGDEITCTAPAGVTGKTCVKISGDKQSDGTYTVATAGVGDLVFGVAAWDCAAGGRVTVHRIAGGLVVPIKVSGAVAANDPVTVAAGGLVAAAAATNPAIGIALTSAADATDGEIALERFTA